MPKTTGLVYEDLLTFPDDGQRREILDGELLVSPSPNVLHQRLLRDLWFAIESHLRAHGGGEVLSAPTDVVLAPDAVLEPDLLVITDDRASIVTPANLQGPPTIVIEILSDARRDRIRKKSAYARFGIPEYWIVDPDSEWLEVYRLDETGSAYRSPEILQGSAVLTTKHLPGFTLEVAELFARTA